MPVPFTSFEVRWVAGCSAWDTGFAPSSTKVIMPDVGVLVVNVEAEAGVSLGDGIDSPRSRASVEGESCGARCDLRLWRSIICTAHSCKSTGVRLAAARNMSFSF